MLLNIQTCPDFTYWRKQLLPLANEFSGQLTFVMSDEKEFSQELEDLQMADWGEDVAMAIWDGAKKKYPMKEDYDLREFVEVRSKVIPSTHCTHHGLCYRNICRAT